MITGSFQAKAQDTDLSQRNIVSVNTIYTTYSKDFEGSPLLNIPLKVGGLFLVMDK